MARTAAGVADGARLDALRRAGLMDSPRSEAYDRLTALAARMLRCPMALVSFFDDQREFLMSSVGLPPSMAEVREVPLSYSLCQYTVNGVPLTVSDTRLHPVLTDNGAVQEGRVAAVISIPLTEANGHVLGALSVMDVQPRRWTQEEVDTLSDLAAAVTTEIDLHVATEAARALAEERLVLLDGERETRVQAEMAERTLRTVIDRVPAGIVVTDTAGRTTFLNPVGHAITNVSGPTGLDLIEQQHVYALRNPTTGAPLEPQDTPIARALRGEVVEAQDLLVRRTDGQDVWVQVSAAPVVEAGGSITGAIAVFSDVTTQRRSDQERDDFLSAAAHDLKGPLTGIQGFAQLLRRRIVRDGEVDPETALDWLDRIDSTAARMGRMISELLDITRVQKGLTLTLNRTPANLATVLRRMVVEQCEGHDRVVDLTIEDEDLDGLLDVPRMERAMGNLLDNAIKYSPEETPITIRAWRDGPDAVVTVQDRGIGIPARDLPRVFDRFYRGSNVQRETPGTGIGLASARQVVEQHGGHISVRSGPHEGTTFTVRVRLQS